MAAVKIPDISTFSRQVFTLPTMASSKNEKNQELSDILTSSHMYTAHKTLLAELNHKNKTEKIKNCLIACPVLWLSSTNNGLYAVYISLLTFKLVQFIYITIYYVRSCILTSDVKKRI